MRNDYGINGDNRITGFRRLSMWQRILLVFLALFVLSWIGYTAYNHIPSSSSTVTITPVTHPLQGMYSIGVSSGLALSNTIQGRKIVFTSQKLSQTVTATGKGHHLATAATGSIVLSQIHLYNSKNNTIEPSTLAGLSGVSVTTDDDVTVSEGETVTLHAHADQAGSGGNITAYDFNSPGVIVNTTTHAQEGTGYISNPHAFSGGTDAYDFTFVQQSDINKVTAALSKQLTPNTLTKVRQQIQAGERSAQDIQCNPGTSSNHHANDQASNVIVTVSVTCSALVYNEQTLLQAAIAAYKMDVVTKFGEDYGVVGSAQTSTPSILDAQGTDSAQFSITVNGVCSYKWDKQQRDTLLHLLAGKPLSDAQSILNQRIDIKTYSIENTFFPGGAIPTNVANIKLVITQANGS